MGDAFGPKFLVVGAGLLISLHWHSLYTSASLLSVWKRLVAGKASAKDTVLVCKAAMPLTAIAPALKRRDWAVVITATLATSADVLTIALARVPCRSGEREVDSIVCLWISVAVLGCMLLALPGVLWWMWRVRVGGIGEEGKDTIAGVCSYLVGGPLVRATVETGEHYTGRVDRYDDDVALKRWRLSEYGWKERRGWIVDEDGEGIGEAA
jgi:hypothetical protein